MEFVAIATLILLFLFARDIEKKIKKMSEKLDQVDNKTDKIYDKIEPID